MNNISGSINVQLGDNQKLAYDKAIEAYQFHVNRYNTWMNYYSVFVGAFFVALYNVWPQKMGLGCCCCCHAACISALFLPITIAALGLIASVCWQASAIGHYSWMKSYIKILHDREAAVLEPQLSVYGRIHNSYWDRVCKCVCTNSAYACGYISTQKVTQLFICAIMVAWLLVLAVLLGCGLSCRLFWSCIAGAAVVWFILRCFRVPLWSDNLNGMSDRS